MPIGNHSGRQDLNNAASGSVALSASAGQSLVAVAEVWNTGGVFASGDFTDSLGQTWALDKQHTQAGVRVGIWRLQATSGAVTVTFDPVNSAGGLYGSWSVFAYSGLQASPLDKTAQNAGTGGTADPGTTAALAQASELVVAVVGVDTSASTVDTPSAGYTNLWENETYPTGNPGAADYKEVAATTGVTASWAIGTPGSGWAAIIATYKLAVPASLVLSAIANVAAPTMALMAPSPMTLSAVAAVSAPTMELTAPGGTLLPSAVAATASASMALRAPALLALSAVGNLSALTGAVSTRGFIVPSPVPAALSLLGAVSTRGFIVASPVASVGAISGTVIAPAVFLSLHTDGQSSIVIMSVTAPTPRRGIRVDIYDYDGVTKIGSGPIETLSRIWYRNYLDEVGQGRVTLSTSDAQRSLLIPRRHLRLYIGGEGLVFRGQILPYTAAPYGPMELNLAGLEHQLVDTYVGLGRTFSARTPSQLLGDVLPSGWSAGIVDSVGPTFTRPIWVRNAWQVLVDAAKVYGVHVRADHVSISGANPVQQIDMVTGSASTGLILKTVSDISPELSENDSVLPLVEIKEMGDGAQIYNHLVAFGLGEGYPIISLKTATLGLNQITNPGYETGTLADTTGSNASVAASTAQAKDGTYSVLVTRTAGTVFGALWTPALVGAVNGQTLKIGVWLYGDPSVVGKSAAFSAIAIGGAGLDVASASPTVVAGWQYVEMVMPITATRTSVQIVAQVNGAVAGDRFYVDRRTLWLSTNAPYPVEWEVTAGGLPEYFIEDQTSVALYGKVPLYAAVKDVAPIVATKAAYMAAVDDLYNIGARLLLQHKAHARWYSGKPLGLKHIRDGAQVIEPGSTVRLLAEAPVLDIGATVLRSGFSADATVTVLGYERTVDDGGDDWQLELSDVAGGLSRIDDAQRLEQMWDDFARGQNDYKQSNWSYETSRTADLGNDPGVVSAVAVRPPMVNVLAVQKASLFVQQLGGVQKNVVVSIFGTGMGGGPVFLAVDVDITAGMEFDVTEHFQQAPTPVPWPDPNPGIGDFTAAVGLYAAGAGPYQYLVQLTIECTKMPVVPP